MGIFDKMFSGLTKTRANLEDLEEIFQEYKPLSDEFFEDLEEMLILSDMGMPRAFTPQADFSSLSPEALFLYFVQQDAIIKVDEEGTEAAAVSIGGMMKETAAPPMEKVVFHADHPFLYLISENSTGAILFAGRYGAE